MLATHDLIQDMGEYAEPCCHIGITPVVRRERFSWSEVSVAEMQILQFERPYQPKPGLLLIRNERSIGLYPNVRVPDLDIIAQVDPLTVHREPLIPSPGTEGGRYPYYPSIGSHLGMEAVVTWRREHDSHAWQAEIAEASAEYFEREEKRLRMASEKAAERRSRRGI